jgi:hypothetical protein
LGETTRKQNGTETRAAIGRKINNLEDIHCFREAVSRFVRFVIGPDAQVKAELQLTTPLTASVDVEEVAADLEPLGLASSGEKCGSERFGDGNEDLVLHDDARFERSAARGRGDRLAHLDIEVQSELARLMFEDKESLLSSPDYRGSMRLEKESAAFFSDPLTERRICIARDRS